MIDRSLVHGLIIEELYADGSPSGARVLSEGLTEDTVRNILQSVVAGAAEYGLAATVAGAPAAPVAETAVDIAFTGGNVLSAASAVKSAIGSGSELGSLYEAAEGALKGEFNPEALYRVVRSALTALGTAGGASLIEKVKKKSEELLGRISSAISDAIKSVIPDAILGVSVSQAILTAINMLAGNSYTLVASAIEKLGGLKDYLTVPGKAASFFKKALPDLVAMIRKFADKIDGVSNLTAALGGASGLIIKNAGPAGLRKVADILEQKTPEIVEVVSSIVGFIVPAMLAAVAALQSIIKGDYKKSVTADGTKVSAAPDAITTVSESINEIEMALLEMRVRRIRRSRRR